MIAADATGEMVTGAFGVFIGLLILSLAICWLIFPVVVVSKLNQLLKLGRELIIEIRKKP